MFVIKWDFNMFDGFVEYFRGKEYFIEFVIVGGRVKFHDLRKWINIIKWNQLIDRYYLFACFIYYF